MRRPVVLAALFLAAIVLANWVTNRYGFVTVAPGLDATAGTFAAGATLTIRDALQDRAGRWPVLVLVVIGAAVSALVSPTLGLASGVAFLAAEAADFAVYTPLRARSWDLAVWASAAVGAVADTALFLWLAFGTLTAEGVTGQVVGKLEATLVVWWLLRRWRP